jgi:hypothetical protein
MTVNDTRQSGGSPTEELTTFAASLLGAFLVQAAPLIEDAALRGLRTLLDLMPGTNAEQLQWGALDIIRGIWNAHPDWPDTEKRRYAVDAITLLAHEMGVPISAATFTQLALA